MPLAIRITDGVTTFRLQTESFVVGHSRQPRASPLPNNAPLLIDLGSRKTELTISGVAAEVGTDESDEGVTIADRDDLETIAEAWGDTETVTITDARPSVARVYTVKIVNIKLERKGDRDFYDFILQAVGFRSSP